MRKKSLPPISRNVFLLSVVSFLNDIGGETIKKTIPLYLSSVLGVKPSIIGLIEGIADATPQLFQPISGFLSDKFAARKPFVVLGQFLRSLVLLLALSNSWIHILLIRFFDRSGKGIANAPRDALVIDSSTPATVGRSFGLTRAFDNAGAVIGFLITASIISFSQRAYQDVMTKELFQLLVLLAVVPLMIAFGIVTLGIKDVIKKQQRQGVKIGSIGKKYWVYLFICTLFTLGNSSDAFLMFRTQELQISLSIIFLLLAISSATSSISGFVFSSLSDKVGRKKILLSGWVLFTVIYLFFTNATLLYHIVGLFFLYGLALGMIEGTMKAWVADLVPKEMRGTAFGIFNMVIGVTFLPASFLTGIIWQTSGLSQALQVDAGIAFVAAILLFFL